MMQFVEPTPERPISSFVADQGERLSDIPESDFIDAYKRYGVILLRGFDVEMDDFNGLTARYCSSSVFNESPDRDVLDQDRNVQTVNFGTDAFPLHPEMSREPWRPDICFFWCISPPGVGGQTTVCDGVEIVKNMPREVFNAFKDRQLVYTQRMAPEVCAYWLGSATPDDETIRNPKNFAPYSFFRTPMGVARTFSRPALHKPMFSDELAFANFILFARNYLRLPNFPMFDGPERIPDDLVARVKEISARLTFPLDWNQGDIAVVDNTRFMHGRNRITNAEERKIATYFGYLRFAEPRADEWPDAPWRKANFLPPRVVPGGRPPVAQR